MSNYKKRPHLKSGPPTWREINSVKCVKCPKMRKGNNELKKHLEKLGWKMWDSCNIWETGYTITLKKVCTELEGNRNPYLFFGWHWDNQGFENFWVGNIHGFYDYMPELKYMRPSGTFEVRDITERDKKHIDAIEKQVIAAIKTQKRLC